MAKKCKKKVKRLKKGGRIDFPGVKYANPYLIPEHNIPRANGNILPDPSRAQLQGTNASEYKIGAEFDGNEVQIPRVVGGQLLDNQGAVDRYKLTGNKFKKMANPSSYSRFYDEASRLGIMQNKAKGGQINKNKDMYQSYKGSNLQRIKRANGGRVGLANGGSPSYIGGVQTNRYSNYADSYTPSLNYTDPDSVNADLNWGTIATSTASGLAAGTAVNPGIGTAVGGVVGFGAGLFGAKKEQQFAKQQQDDIRSQNRMDRSIYDRFRMDNYKLGIGNQYSYYADGGRIPMQNGGKLSNEEWRRRNRNLASIYTNNNVAQTNVQEDNIPNDVQVEPQIEPTANIPMDNFNNYRQQYEDASNQSSFTPPVQPVADNRKVTPVGDRPMYKDPDRMAMGMVAGMGAWVNNAADATASLIGGLILGDPTKAKYYNTIWDDLSNTSRVGNAMTTKDIEKQLQEIAEGAMNAYLAGEGATISKGIKSLVTKAVNKYPKLAKSLKLDNLIGTTALYKGYKPNNKKMINQVIDENVDLAKQYYNTQVKPTLSNMSKSKQQSLNTFNKWVNKLDIPYNQLRNDINSTIHQGSEIIPESRRLAESTSKSRIASMTNRNSAALPIVERGSNRNAINFNTYKDNFIGGIESSEANPLDNVIYKRTIANRAKDLSDKSKVFTPEPSRIPNSRRLAEVSSESDVGNMIGRGRRSTPIIERGGTKGVRPVDRASNLYEASSKITPKWKIRDYYNRNLKNSGAVDFDTWYKSITDDPNSYKQITKEIRQGFAKGGAIASFNNNNLKDNINVDGNMFKVGAGYELRGAPNTEDGIRGTIDGQPVQVDNKEVIVKGRDGSTVVISDNLGEADKYRKEIANVKDKNKLQEIAFRYADRAVQLNPNPEGKGRVYGGYTGDDMSLFGINPINKVGIRQEDINNPYYNNPQDNNITNRIQYDIPQGINRSGNTISDQYYNQQMNQPFGIQGQSLTKPNYFPKVRESIPIPTVNRTNSNTFNRNNAFGGYGTQSGFNLGRPKLQNTGRSIYNINNPFDATNLASPSGNYNGASSPVQRPSFVNRAGTYLNDNKLGIARGLGFAATTLGNINAANRLNKTKPSPYVTARPLSLNPDANRPIYSNQIGNIKRSSRNLGNQILDNTANSNTALSRLGAVKANEINQVGDINSRRIADRNQILNNNINTQNRFGLINNQGINNNNRFNYQDKLGRINAQNALVGSTVSSLENVIDNIDKGTYQDEMLEAIALSYGIKLGKNATAEDYRKAFIQSLNQQLTD